MTFNLKIWNGIPLELMRGTLSHDRFKNIDARVNACDRSEIKKQKGDIDQSVNQYISSCDC